MDREVPNVLSPAYCEALLSLMIRGRLDGPLRYCYIGVLSILQVGKVEDVARCCPSQLVYKHRDRASSVAQNHDTILNCT